jgi:hypothetical protein
VIVVVVIFGQRLVVLLVVVAVINVAAAEGVYVLVGAIAHCYCYNYTKMIFRINYQYLLQSKHSLPTL